MNELKMSVVAGEETLITGKIVQACDILSPPPKGTWAILGLDTYGVVGEGSVEELPKDTHPEFLSHINDRIKSSGGKYQYPCYLFLGD